MDRYASLILITSRATGQRIVLCGLMRAETSGCGEEQIIITEVISAICGNTALLLMNGLWFQEQAQQIKQALSVHKVFPILLIFLPGCGAVHHGLITMEIFGCSVAVLCGLISETLYGNMFLIQAAAVATFKTHN